jgi:hypothetical protein
MINATYYNLLPMGDKVQLLEAKGEFLELFSSPEFDISIYAMDGQYVELIFSIPYDKIEAIRVVEDLDKLAAYASEYVDVKKLIN